MVQIVNRLIATFGIAITTSFLTFTTINAKTKLNLSDDQNLAETEKNEETLDKIKKQKESKNKDEKKKDKHKKEKKDKHKKEKKDKHKKVKEKDKNKKKDDNMKNEFACDSDNDNDVFSDCINRLSQWRQINGIPGFVVGVSLRGKTIWKYAEGYADIENSVKCNERTVMRIASISKSITSALLAKLLEDNKLDLDVSVNTYLTKEQFPDKYWEGEKVDITLRQLASHLGGIRHYKKLENGAKTDAKPVEQSDKKKSDNTKTDENKKSENNELGEFSAKEYYLKQTFPSVIESLNLFKDDPLIAKPGTKFVYTTFGFTLLSAVIETQLNGQRFEKYLIKFLREQLGMNNTYLDEHEPIIYNRSSYYHKVGQNGRLLNAPYVDNSYKWAGGGLLSDVSDLLKFGNIMLYSYKGGANGKQGFLKMETVDKMWTPADNTKVSNPWVGYGIGWVAMRNGTSLYAYCAEPLFADLFLHTGGAVGASSVLLIEPKSELVVTILANLQNAGNISGMAHYIAQQLTQQSNNEND